MNEASVAAAIVADGERFLAGLGQAEPLPGRAAHRADLSPSISLSSDAAARAVGRRTSLPVQQQALDRDGVRSPSRERSKRLTIPKPPPFSIPQPVRDFKGYEDEIAAVQAALAEGSALISAVQGIGGVGKTELAREVAAADAGRLPGRADPRRHAGHDAAARGAGCDDGCAHGARGGGDPARDAGGRLSQPARRQAGLDPARQRGERRRAAGAGAAAAGGPARHLADAVRAGGRGAGRAGEAVARRGQGAAWAVSCRAWTTPRSTRWPGCAPTCPWRCASRAPICRRPATRSTPTSMS